MAKFNVTQKKRRAKIQEQKREAHGHPVTRKLKQRTSPVAISGKRQRKILKKLKREQKEALETGLITMGDVEMAAADGTSQVNNQKAQMKFHVKSGSRLKIKKSKGRGKSKRKSTKLPADVSVPVDAMVE
ncbi:Uncharacterized protein M6B38_224265 [Iris pallida]|uniref:Uncharacterized protein n=1 Tax=Iris pallida TaxID=29817 RepID=A0AAX6DVP4_IRIPA|nr:Uncharacterized protein M6B38_224265 [Iris pallida]